MMCIHKCYLLVLLVLLASAEALIRHRGQDLQQLRRPRRSGNDYDYYDDKPHQSFVKTPENTTAVVGSRVVLSCRVQNPLGAVQWTRDGFGMGMDRGKLLGWDRFRVIGRDPKLDWDLEITNVTLDDDVLYDCQCMNSSVKSPPGKLTVFVPPEAPHIMGGNVQSVVENRQVTIECVSKRGKPAPKIDWFDDRGDLVNESSYKSRLIGDTKLFEAVSLMRIIPTKDMHNRTFRCEAWNEASRHLRPAFLRLEVQYAPSVTVQPIRPGVPMEGDKFGFSCMASANPPPYPDRYRWYLDGKLIPGQYGYYYQIKKLSRAMHGRQVKCSVENQLGKANGINTIQVAYAPLFVQQPRRLTPADLLEQVTLYCVVESNPAPIYQWTKGNSRDLVSNDQNLTLHMVNEGVAGVYFCHAHSADPVGSPVTSQPAEVILKAPPRRLPGLARVQTGRLGQDVHINCAATSVPEPTQVAWKYHGVLLDENNPHYRIINSPIENGRRSTLIITQSLDTDFGTYVCMMTNQMGTTDMDIELEQEEPFPLILIASSAFFCLAILVAVLCLLLCRKRLLGAGQKDKNKANNNDNNTVAAATTAAAVANNMIKVNNLDRQLSQERMKEQQDAEDTPSSFSNEPDDSACWEGCSDLNNDFSSRNSSQLIRHNDPEFPPKPDVISTGYVSYGHYDYNPPSLHQGGQSIYGSTTATATTPPPAGGHQMQRAAASRPLPPSLLNVSDPRYSATYGNPFLKETASYRAKYSTFLPPPSPTASSPPPSSSPGPAAVGPGRLAAASPGPLRVSSSPAPGSIDCCQPLLSQMAPVTTAAATVSMAPMHQDNSSMHGSLSSGRGGSLRLGMAHPNQQLVISSTPSSSIGNMACLPEEDLGRVGGGDDALPLTVTPPPNQGNGHAQPIDYGYLPLLRTGSLATHV